MNDLPCIELRSISTPAGPRIEAALRYMRGDNDLREATALIGTITDDAYFYLAELTRHALLDIDPRYCPMCGARRGLGERCDCAKLATTPEQAARYRDVWGA